MTFIPVSTSKLTYFPSSNLDLHQHLHAPADTSDSVQKAVHAGLAIGCFVIGALGAVTTVTTTKWSVSAACKAFKRLQGHANPVSSSLQEELTTAASDRFLLSGSHADCESDVLG